MILFVTNQGDEQTRWNCEIISQIGSATNDKRLCGAVATSTNLYMWLRRLQDNSIFIMSHGNVCRIRDSDNQITLQVATNESRLLWNRKMFVYACLTGKIDGQDTSLGKYGSHNSLYFGYTRPITIPCVRKDRNALVFFVEIFTYIINYFGACHTLNDAEQFIAQIKSMCDISMKEISKLRRKNRKVSLSTYTALREMYTSLVCWKNQTYIYPNEVNESLENSL